MEFLTNLIPSELEWTDGVPYLLEIFALGNEMIGLIPQTFPLFNASFEYSCLNGWMRFWLFLEWGWNGSLSGWAGGVDCWERTD